MQQRESVIQERLRVFSRLGTRNKANRRFFHAPKRVTHALRSSVPTLPALALTLGLASLMWWKTGQSPTSKLAALGSRYATKAEMEKVSHVSSNKHIRILKVWMIQAIAEVVVDLGDDSVSIDDEVLFSHGFSEWSNYNADRLPVAVVFPSSTEDVAQIVKISKRYRIPLSKRITLSYLVARQADLIVV